jgi:hypothetical protein
MKSLKSLLWSVKLAESPWNVPMPKAQLLTSPYLPHHLPVMHLVSGGIIEIFATTIVSTTDMISS